MFRRSLSTLTIVFASIVSTSDATQFIKTHARNTHRANRGGFFKPGAWRGGSSLWENNDDSSLNGNARAINTADAKDTTIDTSTNEDVETKESPSTLVKAAQKPASQVFLASQTKSLASSKVVYPLSICSIQGKRQYMEDEYFTNQNGSFCSVMDGHGGSAVSRYLRQNLYARYLQAKDSTISNARKGTESVRDCTTSYVDTEQSCEDDSHIDVDVRNEDDIISSQDAKHILSNKLSDPHAASTQQFTDIQDPLSKDDTSLDDVTLQACIQALKSAFEKIDAEVQRISHWSFQGSTAVACKLHKIPSSGQTVLISANVGDSRAILSRSGKAIDLTKDHKPNDPIERARIESLGGRVDWFGPVDKNGKPLRKRTKNGCYRINKNLALSRAIGDRSELPFVSSKVDIEQFILDEEFDEFVVLASDGLWDVFDSSQDVVSFCRNNIQKARSNTGVSMEHKSDPLERVKRKMSKLLVREALRRGSMDNITVIIIWLSI